MDLSGYKLVTLHQDGEFILCRGRASTSPTPHPSSVLVTIPASEHPAPARLEMLEHELALREDLHSTWALRPLVLAQHQGRPALVYEDQQGEPLERLLESSPGGRMPGGRQSAEPAMEVGLFLRLAAGLARALGEVHRRGIIHKNVKPAHVLVNATTGQAWLTGFGIASRLPRERQAPQPPEAIAGTLAYMAPEQTGRMNRSIDRRSDLYAVGVTLYQMLTGSLPFTATEPIEWVHCHVARQPVAPRALVANVPAPVSAIIVKLLAKTAEERYQTAAGLERDLRRCLAGWEADRSIDDFSLGDHDIPDRLLIPEKLYGREREIETLLAAFAAAASGRPRLVLVSGYAGIGKSSVVNELHKALVPQRGLFASGKFDQLKRDIPYATLAQAFQVLIRQLLLKPEAELAEWRDELRQALHPNGGLLLDLIPELRFVIGEQPAVPDVQPAEAKGRFQMTLRRLIGVFARPEHPLALVLDDLQWLDGATLDLLEDLLVHPAPQHLLLVGAYRDNEVDTRHPLTRTLSAIRGTGAVVQDIVLGPLEHDDLVEWFADALHSGRERTLPLARLVREKTAGNPFFTSQFLQELVDDDLITFEPSQASWRWDLAPIRSRGYADNVVDLMIGKLSRLPLITQKALKGLAYLGDHADASTLATVRNTSEPQLHAQLWEALRLELVVRTDDSYRFVHDRVQEAAHSLFPEEQPAPEHLRIGRLLLTRIAPGRREETIFEIVGHFNRSLSLIASSEEREQVAALNLLAGKRARKAAAFSSALSYVVAGGALLEGHGWRHDLVFELDLLRAECELLTGDVASAEQRLRRLSSHAANLVQRCAVACLQAEVYPTLEQSERGLEACIDCLQQAGLDIPLHPTDAQVRMAYDRICSKLDGLGLDEIAALPLLTDAATRAILEVVPAVHWCSATVDWRCEAMTSCAAIDLVLEHGIDDAACWAFGFLGYLAAWHFDDFDAAVRFGQLGYELIERTGLRRFEAAVSLSVTTCVMQWTRHVLSCRPVIRRILELAHSTGNQHLALAGRNRMVSNLLLAGDPLIEAEREAQIGIALWRRGTAILGPQAALIRNLRGVTRRFGSLDDEQFDEQRLENYYATEHHFETVECRYWIIKLQARFFAGDYAAALEASHRAQTLVPKSLAVLELAENVLYSALAHAAACDSPSSDDGPQHIEAIAAHQRQLEAWARHCPENFENRALLVAAEIARIEGRDSDATWLYEQAIRSARDHGFVHNEALALEIAARFYEGRGFARIARAYLRDARDGYRQWGADGKVRQLEMQYPYLRDDRESPDPMRTVLTPVEHLDLATVIKLSQAVSGEMVLEKLIDTLMRSAIEHAGAERAVLILSRGADQRVVADATTDRNLVLVRLCDEAVTADRLPEAVLRYVVHTRESVLLDDATEPNLFSGDPYLDDKHIRSVLCLPLTNQTKLIGALYLENNLAPRVFAPARSAVLKLLASQAAISLENSRLYRDLAERESRIRRLVDANIIGIFIWDHDGTILEANDAFLTMVGYTREELGAGRLRWTELTAAEWRERDEQLMPELTLSGTLQPFEKEYLRKDGSRVPVLIGVAAFDEPGKGVAFVLDLTERKRAEEAMNRANAELAHVSRVTALSALTASIAHEVNQPLAGIMTNAGTCLRMLDATPPDLDGARQTARRTMRDGQRASDVITRLRAMFSKGEVSVESLDLNETVREVVALSSHEFQRQGIALQMELAGDLPTLKGDRVQLQQVLLNLIRNASEAMAEVEEGLRQLRITTARDTGHVRVSVRDAGVGLSPQSLESLFDPFYTTKSGGMGIGLFVSRSIEERHLGRLWAEPNESGSGATVSFSIPNDGD